MGHNAANRLDQLPDGGRVVRILVDRHDDQATELALFPVIQHGRGERTFEADHHHRADLLAQGQPGRTEDRVLVSGRRTTTCSTWSGSTPRMVAGPGPWACFPGMTAWAGPQQPIRQSRSMARATS